MDLSLMAAPTVSEERRRFGLTRAPVGTVPVYLDGAGQSAYRDGPGQLGGAMTDGPLNDQRTDRQSGPLLFMAGFDSEQIAAVRRALARHLLAAGLDGQRLDDFVTAINEAMTNAVQHGGGWGELRLWRDRELVCEIRDRGPGLSESVSVPRAQRPRPSATGGMGLWLAQELADSIDVDSGGDGLRVRLAMAFAAGQEAWRGRQRP